MPRTLLDRMAAAAAAKALLPWDELPAASQEHWRDYIRLGLQALKEGANDLTNEEARTTIPRIVDYINKGA